MSVDEVRMFDKDVRMVFVKSELIGGEFRPS